MNTLVNFRDLGGIKTLDNKVVVGKQFLRSGQVVNLSESDKSDLINDYDLKLIVDFRSDGEIAEAPDDTLKNVAYEHINIIPETPNQGTGLKELTNPKYSPEKYMLETYEQFVVSEEAQKGYREFLMGFIDKPNECTLFHCYAGKDRTGYGAALILSSLNVSRDAIFEDYLKTNESRKAANDVILGELKEKGLTEAELSQVSIMLDVDKSYLEKSFDIIDNQYGGIDTYFTKTLGLPADFQTKMRSLYTK